MLLSAQIEKFSVFHMKDLKIENWYNSHFSGKSVNNSFWQCSLSYPMIYSCLLSVSSLHGDSILPARIVTLSATFPGQTFVRRQCKHLAIDWRKGQRKCLPFTVTTRGLQLLMHLFNTIENYHCLNNFKIKISFLVWFFCFAKIKSLIIFISILIGSICWVISGIYTNFLCWITFFIYPWLS